VRLVLLSQSPKRPPWLSCLQWSLSIWLGVQFLVRDLSLFTVALEWNPGLEWFICEKTAFLILRPLWIYGILAVYHQCPHLPRTSLPQGL